MGSKHVAILICTEAGTLECMSRLLVKSIRKFGGALKEANIYSVQPRNPEPLSKKTMDTFEACKVHHEYLPLNKKYPGYGLANKVAACDYYARNLSHDYLLFLDSDNVVFNDLGALLDKPEADVSIRVVGQKGVGSEGNDENASYWKSLYTLFGVKNPSFVKTGIEGERIFSYYNSGLIFVRRDSGLFERWRDNFETVMDMGLMPHQGLFFVEQSVLSATINSMDLDVEELSATYNYSPQSHFNLKSQQEQLTLDQIHTFHYHRLFNPPNRVHLEKDFEGFEGEKLEWLKRELINCDINPRPFYEHWELDLLKKKEDIFQLMKDQKRN